MLVTFVETAGYSRDKSVRLAGEREGVPEGYHLDALQTVVHDACVFPC